MTIAALNKLVDTWGTLYARVNTLITFANSNDPANLTTTDKTSLVAGINEVNSKKIPFVKKDGTTANISLGS